MTISTKVTASPSPNAVLTRLDTATKEHIPRNSASASGRAEAQPSTSLASGCTAKSAADGSPRIVEVSTSWCYVGAGLRLSMELLGPEYAMEINSPDPGLKVFLSREVVGDTGEDLVEKQNAETGVMPIVADEEAEYGYTGENRHMVQAFRAGEMPLETFADGVAVTDLLAQGKLLKAESLCRNIAIIDDGVALVGIDGFDVGEWPVFVLDLAEGRDVEAGWIMDAAPAVACGNQRAALLFEKAGRVAAGSPR